MLASNPASILNQNPADLGILNRFNPNESDSRLVIVSVQSVYLPLNDAEIVIRVIADDAKGEGNEGGE
jgi:hypothetical protein